MSMGDFINIQPSELKFPVESRKQSSCSMQLVNKTDQFIAFKVKTTNPKKYSVRPNAGIVLPNSVCNVTGKNPLIFLKIFGHYVFIFLNFVCLVFFKIFVLVFFCPLVTMQAQKDVPPDMQCRDKFLVQSAVAPNGSTNKDVTQEMFNREDGKVVNEFKLRVIYIPANPPSPVPEGDEEGNSPRSSSAEEEIRKSALSEAAWAAVSKLNEEKASAIQQNKKLQEELELLRKQTRHGQGARVSTIVVLFCLLLGILLGYFIKK
ncbi:vesicle-associated protein 1-3-like isoform X2 [Primulina huaijiensis]|uniref:vesicle-associated protein 1-3-like isoform X2 n=1 Tax=Primulina huaijiensis TaxID=1492673 RepID=UPI003CC79615